MHIVGIDVETTGLDIDKDHIIELAAARFEYDSPLYILRAGVCEKIHEAHYPPLSEEIKELTGISDYQGAIDLVSMMELVMPLLDGAQLIVAHNAQFDRGMLVSQLRRQGQKAMADHLGQIPWACTIDDVPHHKKRKCKKLSHLALDMGVAVNPAELHRAAADVELMGKLLTASCVDARDMLRRALSPTHVYRAMVPAPWKDSAPEGKKGAQLAKASGYFHWNKEDQSWYAELKDFEAEEILTTLPFEARFIRRKE